MPIPIPRPLAAVTGAAAGIGYELARCCAENDFDLLITADEPRIHEAAHDLRATGAYVEAVHADLSTRAGVDRFYAAANGRPIEAVLATAGRGLGRAFLDQSFEDVRRVIDTNVTGTLYLMHKVASEMRARGRGKILIAGAPAAFFPEPFQAVYDGTKAFLDSFAAALRDELRGSGVTVTCLLPGPTDTELFERAGLLGANFGQGQEKDPADLARIGFEAMENGDGDVIGRCRNKLESEARA